ncbi:hypothetical protein [Parashewanella tropica]|uniref:hypothetical protein n=1 Tax=Parashewanella tropica TaxID=2547970 RepID=UPI0010598FC4|nr:hypothetical protein [Parashewanella tropica]
MAAAPAPSELSWSDYLYNGLEVHEQLQEMSQFQQLSQRYQLLAEFLVSIANEGKTSEILDLLLILDTPNEISSDVKSNTCQDIIKLLRADMLPFIRCLSSSASYFHYIANSIEQPHELNKDQFITELHKSTSTYEKKPKTDEAFDELEQIVGAISTVQQQSANNLYQQLTDFVELLADIIRDANCTDENSQPTDSVPNH